jgi:hypothetical protein
MSIEIRTSSSSRFPRSTGLDFDGSPEQNKKYNRVRVDNDLLSAVWAFGTLA